MKDAGLLSSCVPATSCKGFSFLSLGLFSFLLGFVFLVLRSRSLDSLSLCLGFIPYKRCTTPVTDARRWNEGKVNIFFFVSFLSWVFHFADSLWKILLSFLVGCEPFTNFLWSLGAVTSFTRIVKPDNILVGAFACALSLSSSLSFGLFGFSSFSEGLVRMAP